MTVDPAGIYRTSYTSDMSVIRTRQQWIILIAAVLLTALTPFFLPKSVINVMTLSCCVIIATLGIQILTGYTGQVSVGQAAVFGIGAYTSAILVNDLHVPFFLSVFLSGLSAAAVGSIFGIPSLRLKGFYLVMATLAGHAIIIYLVSHVDFTGGQVGHKADYPSIGPFTFDTGPRLFWLNFSFLILMTYLARNIVRGRWGRAFIAIRDNDLAAEVMGIDVYRTKILAFAVGCFFAGIGGALAAHYTGMIHPTQFPLMDGFWYLGYIIVGGLGSIAGCYFGAIFFIAIKEILIRLPVSMELARYLLPMTDVAFGIIIIMALIFDPKGMYHRWELFKGYYRIWPLAYK
jgi:branched-chain amino acid transport system permease protein